MSMQMAPELHFADTLHQARTLRKGLGPTMGIVLGVAAYVASQVSPEVNAFTSINIVDHQMSALPAGATLLGLGIGRLFGGTLGQMWINDVFEDPDYSRFIFSDVVAYYMRGTGFELRHADTTAQQEGKSQAAQAQVRRELQRYGYQDVAGSVVLVGNSHS
jgi:hypothetical protein